MSSFLQIFYITLTPYHSKTFIQCIYLVSEKKLEENSGTSWTSKLLIPKLLDLESLGSDKLLILNSRSSCALLSALLLFSKVPRLKKLHTCKLFLGQTFDHLAAAGAAAIF